MRTPLRKPPRQKMTCFLKIRTSAPATYREHSVFRSETVSSPRNIHWQPSICLVDVVTFSIDWAAHMKATNPCWKVLFWQFWQTIQYDSAQLLYKWTAVGCAGMTPPKPGTQVLLPSPLVTYKSWFRLNCAGLLVCAKTSKQGLALEYTDPFFLVVNFSTVFRRGRI
jgi:hypothetical protein